MQIVPATGRRLARNLGVGGFSTERLTDPEVNIKLGTYYFSRLVEQFGGVHYALASYNAGENRVVRWRAERPGLDEDEFIDDIPFPETQNYVKRILGTAEDYRNVYGNGELPPRRRASSAPANEVPAAAKSNATAAETKKPAAKKATTKKTPTKKAPAKKPAPKKASTRKTPPRR